MDKIDDEEFLAVGRAVRDAHRQLRSQAKVLMLTKGNDYKLTKGQLYDLEGTGVFMVLEDWRGTI